MKMKIIEYGMAQVGLTFQQNRRPTARRVAARRGATAAAAVGPGAACRGARGGPPAPPWASAAATLGPGAVRHGAQVGRGGEVGRDNLGRGHTHKY